MVAQWKAITVSASIQTVMCGLIAISSFMSMKKNYAYLAASFFSEVMNVEVEVFLNQILSVDEKLQAVEIIFWTKMVRQVFRLKTKKN